MSVQNLSRLMGALVIAAIAGPLLAAPADEARARIKAYGELGKAFKTVNDALRGGDARSAAVQQAISRISIAAHDQYSWFPVTSQPRPGLKTSAKLEIWSKPAEFRAAQDALSAQALVLQRTISTGDVEASSAEARKLGATCKSCHTAFRK